MAAVAAAEAAAEALAAAAAAGPAPAAAAAEARLPRTRRAQPAAFGTRARPRGTMSPRRTRPTGAHAPIQNSWLQQDP
eukprot:365070-Chlamydomonas_euryale.AAC.7